MVFLGVPEASHVLLTGQFVGPTLESDHPMGLQLLVLGDGADGPFPHGVTHDVTVLHESPCPLLGGELVGPCIPGRLVCPLT